MKRSLALLPALFACAFSFAQDAPKPASEPAHFHHVHLNVTDLQRSIDFYEKTFGAVPIKYRGLADALFVERSFILFNKVAASPDPKLNSGVWHMGWGGVDVPSEYEWFKKQGVKIHTPLYNIGGRTDVTYLQGPDDELIEVNTTGNHRFGHVHFFAEDVNATCQWYADALGLDLRRREIPKPADMSTVRAWSNSFRCDNVSMIVYGRPDYEPRPPWWTEPLLTSFAPTDGKPIDHIAFSYRKIEPVFERMKSAGVEIVQPIAARPEFGFRSFFVRAPDRVLVEIVEEKPIPDAAWE